MSSLNLIRGGGLAAMLGGVVWIIYTLLGLAGGDLQESNPLDILIIIAWLLQVVGVVGFHTLQKRNYGRIGRGSFYTFIVGAPTQALGLLLVLAGSKTLGELLIGVGGLGIMVGLILYGAATLQAKVLPRWCGIAIIPVGKARKGGYGRGGIYAEKEPGLPGRKQDVRSRQIAGRVYGGLYDHQKHPISETVPY